MRIRFNRVAMAVCAAAIALPSAAAFAVTDSSSAATATAAIDWSTFTSQVFDVNPLDGVVSALTWGALNTGVNVIAGSYTGDYSSDWTTSVSATQDLGYASADASNVFAGLTSIPTSDVTAWSNRSGDFTLTAKSIAVFSVDADTFIDMSQPVGGGAYAWTQLRVEGTGPFGTDNQHSYGEKIVWADGTPLHDSGKLYAIFTNLNDSDMTGSVSGFAQVSSYGGASVAAVPEAQTWAMLVVGLGLVGLRLSGRARKPSIRLG